MRAWWSRAFMFQSTPPHGRRPGAGGNPTGGTGFNPRLRTGGDLNSRSMLASVYAVSIHASAREATCTKGMLRVKLKFQSTPPHGRRRHLVFAFDRTGDVSIHASAREATYARPLLFNVSKFQSTPPHGRRPSTRRWTGSMLWFQSTPPHGRRHPEAVETALTESVSIHASAREATPAPAEESPTEPVSIHASAREATPLEKLVKVRKVRFQSTPPHGRRPWTSAGSRELASFNPRLRTGGDFGHLGAVHRRASFNPRLRTGGDEVCVYAGGLCECFNPRLRTGGDMSAAAKARR